MKLAIDAMGGDYAPKVVVQGVNQAIATYPDIEVMLFGDQAQIEQYLVPSPRITIIHTTEKIEGDDEPVLSVRRKKQASMVLAAQAVKNGEADALISAGNTGALLVSGLLIVGRIRHIDRPGLMPIIPTGHTEHPLLFLMDSGANAECKPINLMQFAVLANFYARRVHGMEQPLVGLLNNGTEETKGNELTKAAYKLLQESDLNFVGNLEAKSLLSGMADIVITDGFTGNAVLKTLEGSSKALFSLIKEALLNDGLKAKIGGLLIKDTLLKLKDQFDDSKQGGAILLGVKAPVIKAHGSANEEAIFNAIRQAKKCVDVKIIEEITHYFEMLEEEKSEIAQ